MQVPGSDNVGPGSDILGLELMSEGKETLLEKMKANGTIFELNSMLSHIFISEWTLSLISTTMPPDEKNGEVANNIGKAKNADPIYLINETCITLGGNILQSMMHNQNKFTRGDTKRSFRRKKLKHLKKRITRRTAMTKRNK